MPSATMAMEHLLPYDGGQGRSVHGEQAVSSKWILPLKRDMAFLAESITPFLNELKLQYAFSSIAFLN